MNINEHKWSDEEFDDAEHYNLDGLDEIKINAVGNYYYLNKNDAIAIARHFELTEDDLYPL